MSSHKTPGDSTPVEMSNVENGRGGGAFAETPDSEGHQVGRSANDSAHLGVSAASYRYGVEEPGRSLPMTYHERLYMEAEHAERARAMTPQADGHHHEPYGDDDAPHPVVEPSRQNSGMSTVSMLTGSMIAIPKHLRGIARQIRKLPQEDLLAIAEMTQHRAHRDVYSLLQYTGGAWYLPNIRPVKPEDGEKPWEASYSWKGGAVLALGGRRMEFHPVSYLLRLTMLVLLWFMIWTMLPQWLAEPGSRGYVFDPVVAIVVSSIVGGIICRILQIPPLIGVLWISILWNNVPTVGRLTEGIRPEVRSIASRMGLTLILVRAGFSLSVASVKSMWKNTIAVAFLPAACECVTHSLIANSVFNYGHYTWAFAQGMVCSVVSAAVVVPGVLLLQSEGYGVGKGGPLNLALSAVGIDTVAGVWAANFIFGLLFDSDIDLGLAIALGPIQVIVGAVAGLVLGFVFYHVVEMLRHEADRLPNGKFAESHLASVSQKAGIIFLSTAFALVFLGYKVKFAGGGACATMIFAATSAHMWIKDGDPELIELKKSNGAFLSSFWDLFMMPVLFSMVGSGIDLSKIFNGQFFPKALLIWACSTAVRFIVAFSGTVFMEMTLPQRTLGSLAWLGKAATQAALGGIALERVNEMISAASGDPDRVASLQRYELVIAENIKNISVLFILFNAPIAAISLTKVGPRILPKSSS